VGEKMQMRPVKDLLKPSEDVITKQQMQQLLQDVREIKNIVKTLQRANR
jgi:hypothetical protein